MLRNVAALIGLIGLICIPCGAWELDSFLIGVWGQPGDDAAAAAFRRAGFTTVFAKPETLDLCKRHGLTALLKDYSPQQVAALRDDPAIWGYFVHDEPKAEQFEEVGRKVAALHEADASRPAYVNLMAWINLDDYLAKVQPRVLSYDYYQWWWGTENHIWRLEAHRAAALRAGIPLVCWIEGNADKRWEWGEKGQTTLPDNGPKLRQSVYTSLAYGVKGVLWFNDYVIFEHASGRKMRPQLRKGGKDVAQLNREMHAMGPELVRLRSVDVVHTDPVPKNARGIGPTCPVQTQGRELTLGLFEDPEGRMLAMVVNRSITRPNYAILRFPQEMATRFDRKKGRWECVTPPARPGTAEMLLQPGDGVLLRLGD